MTNYLKLFGIICVIFLGGCTSHGGDRKSPCANIQISSVADNPCNPLPINVAMTLSTVTRSL